VISVAAAPPSGGVLSLMGRNPLDGWRSTDEKSANQQKRQPDPHSKHVFFFLSLSFSFVFHILSRIFFAVLRLARRRPLTCDMVRWRVRVCVCVGIQQKRKKKKKELRENLRQRAAKTQSFIFT